MNSRELVANESPNRIRDHLDRKARYNPTKSLTSLTSALTHEYEDRFLVELIQNAYDAHEPGTREGRVHVCLDESGGGEAVLYVANTGQAFTEENFDALTNVAQSSKPPGEGIGNKGVGFRSVLQVCDSPEIFSCDPAESRRGTFDGFCFGFATDQQIREMVKDDAEYEVVKRDFSRYLLPVVADPTDPFLEGLRADGMVTVIRLPLTSERAVHLARGQVRRLLEPTPPIALFLDRLASITVAHLTGEGEDEPIPVDRDVKDIRGPDDGPRLQWVETVGRRFLMTTRTLTAAEVLAVVEEAIGKRELVSSWAAWDSDVEVSLAVPVDHEHDGEWPSTYTYLPMRVGSPVYAHLHAPFHTKLARLDLKEDSIFNSFLITTAAELAAETIRLLASDTPLDLDMRQRRSAAVDLLCWDGAHIGHLKTALSQLRLDIGNSPLIPVHGPDGAMWTGLEDARKWTSDDLEMLTGDVVQEYAYLLDRSLGLARIARLEDLSEHVTSAGLEASDDEVADWIEKVASGLEKAPLSKWNRFLGDVANVFESRHATALRGRFILLDDKRKLRRSGPWDTGNASATEPTVFIPPRPAGSADEDAELSSVPKNLQRAITFLHDGIKVRTRTGRTFERTPVGELLTKADLVEPFELTAVLGHLERLLAGKVSATTYRQALSWVFMQERASRANVADLARLGLHVPTASGWIAARRAVFSPGWDTPRAGAVAALLHDARGVSASLQALGDGVITDPTHWPFKVKDSDAFRDFLSRCGVRDGLFPVAIRSRTAIRMNGNNFAASTIAHRFEFADHAQWDRHVREAWHGHLEGPYTPYTGQQELWIVPGQEAFDALDATAKDRLAAAVLESLPHWPDEAAKYTFQRRSPHHRSKPDLQVWPSPARTFVEKAAWFPMSDYGRRDDRYFVPVSEGWTFDETTSETAPRFARLAPIDHRRRLDASASARDQLERAGLNTWNNPASAAPRLRELAALVGSAEVPAVELPSMRRAASRAWSQLAGDAGRALPQDTHLVVSRGRALDVVAPSPSDPGDVFVHDVSPGLVAQVLEAGDFPMLVADPADGGRIVALLKEHAGFDVRGTSTIEARIVLDGKELAPQEDSGDALLDIFGHWLIRTLLAIIDLRSSRFARVTNKVLHDAEARLRRMRIATGSNIELVVDNRTLPATGQLAESVHLNDADHPLLVLNAANVPVPSWRALEVLADDLAELIGQSQAASEIRAAALALQRTLQEWREPSDAEIAGVLRCSVESVTDVLHNLRTSTDHLRLLVAPFIGVLAGVDAARRIETEALNDLHELKALAAELVGADAAGVLFASAERAESIDSIRHDLDTDLGALNGVLAELGRDPRQFPELHRAALSRYLDEHRIDLLGELRRRFRWRFDERSDLSDYTRARDFRDIAPDPAWLHGHEIPTESMIAELLDTWLSANGELRPGAPTLEPVDQVRAANRSLLDRRLPAIAEVVRAWSAKAGTEPPDGWTDLQQIRDILGESGALDFVELYEADLLTWLKTLGTWPAEMPATLDHSALGLSPDDHAAAKSAKAASELRKRRHRAELPFGNRTYDTASEELRDFVEAVDESVSDDFLRTRPTLTKLTDIPPRPPGKGRTTGGGRGGSGHEPKPADEVTAAIGLAGEILAYRWLQKTYPETTPDSWVSRNRRFQLGGHPGNDSLGYDFRVARANETLFFEVKATKTDEYAFDIGESELRAARATRKAWYRIIFIKSVLTPDERELLVLPHPLDPSYTQVNQGIRLRFAPGGRAHR